MTLGRKIISHFMTVTRHRHQVMKNCIRAGIPLQGLLHDLSKYSPTEFIVSCVNFQGTRSPNEAERETKGYSSAWMHHKGRNRHHFEYWTDYDPATRRMHGVEMPVNYLIEMFCDRVAASKIYLGDKYTDRSPLEYFERGRQTRMIDEKTSHRLEFLLTMLAEKGEDATFGYIRHLRLRWLIKDTAKKIIAVCDAFSDENGLYRIFCMILSLENISKTYNGRLVLNNVSLNIENTDRIGLVGVNGCGKSTLLGIITGQTDYDSQPEPFVPHLSVTKGMNIGILKQNSGLDRENTVIAEMTSVFEKLLDVQNEMRRLEKEMERPEIHNDKKLFSEISAEYDRRTAEFEAGEGYLINVKIRTVLNGMGFPPENDNKIISTLSGGEKTRLALAKLLLEEPQLLILDEPTNHLDFDTVMWLEDYLAGYKGALLIVSHDRYFLDKLTTSVCEIERGVLKRYKGNYSAFTVQKKADSERQLKEYEAQQEEIAKLKDFIDRNLVRASTSNMAKSRIKKLESMELVEKPVMYEKKAKITFEYDIEPPLDILSVKGLDIIAGSGGNAKLLAKDLSFAVRRGDRIGIVGANGTGKSTLLKQLLKKIPVPKGNIEWNKNIRISFFDQENSQLDFNKTAIDEIHSRRRTMTENQVRSLLALVRITGENVYKKVGVLSGGERAALSFAVMMLERGNVLVLDEPTNHLDIYAKESIEEALCGFGGTIIFVSHDRYLLDRLADRILEIGTDGARLYDTDFEHFMDEKRRINAELRQSEESEKQRKAAEKAKEKNAQAFRSKEQRAKAANDRRRIKEIEEEIERLDRLAEKLGEEMTLPEVCADHELLTQKCTEYEEIKNRSAELTDEWMMLADNL